VRAWAPFAVDAVSYAVSCLTLSRIRTDLRPQPRHGTPTRPLHQVREGYRFVWHQPFMRMLMVRSTISNLVVNACFFVVSLRMIRDGVPAAQIGLVSTCAGIGGILGALAAPYLIDRMRTGTLTMVVGWMCVLPLMPLILWSTPLVAGLSVFTLLLMNPAGNAGIGAYRAAITPDELQGRGGSALNFVGLGLMPVAPVVGGLLLAAWGSHWSIAALVAGTVVAALITTLSRSIRSVPRPSEWAVEAAPVAVPA
jgi:predicted MFS family arabinose efflux permease